MRLLTELVPARILGEATLWVGIVTLVRNIIIAPVGNTQIRFHPQYLSRGIGNWFNRNISSWFKYATVIELVVLLIIFSTWSFINNNFYLALPLILFLYMLFDSVRSFKLNRLSAERKQKYLALWNSADAILINGFFLTTLSLLVSTESYLFGQMLGILAGLLIFGFAYYPKISGDKTEPSFRDQKELKKNILRYGLPFIPLAFLGWVSSLGDRYILGSLMTVEQVGLYSAAYGIASRPFLMSGSIISSFFRPILFQSENDEGNEKSKKIFSSWLLIVLLISVFGVILFYFLGNFVAGILLAEDYRAQAPQIFVLVASGYAFYLITQAFENRLLSFHKSSGLLFPSTASAAVSITANFILIPQLGIIGAALATLLAFFSQMLIIVLIWLNNENRKNKKTI